MTVTKEVPQSEMSAEIAEWYNATRDVRGLGDGHRAFVDSLYNSLERAVRLDVIHIVKASLRREDMEREMDDIVWGLVDEVLAGVVPVPINGKVVARHVGELSYGDVFERPHVSLGSLVRAAVDEAKHYQKHGDESRPLDELVVELADLLEYAQQAQENARG